MSKTPRDKTLTAFARIEGNAKSEFRRIIINDIQPYKIGRAIAEIRGLLNIIETAIEEKPK